MHGITQQRTLVPFLNIMGDVFVTRRISLFFKHSFELLTSHVDSPKMGTNTTLSIPTKMARLTINLTHSSLILQTTAAP